MRPLVSPNSIETILTFLWHTRYWEHAWSLSNFIFRMNFYAIWVITLFLQMSMQSWFENPTTVKWKETLVWRIKWLYYKSIYILWSFNRMLVSMSYPTLPPPSPSQPFKNKDYTPLFLLSIGCGNPSRWTTCKVSPRPSMEMIVYSWLLKDSIRWPFWQPTRRVS
jgi:hypothetical protein